MHGLAQTNRPDEMGFVMLDAPGDPTPTGRIFETAHAKATKGRRHGVLQKYKEERHVY